MKAARRKWLSRLFDAAAILFDRRMDRAEMERRLEHWSYEDNVSRFSLRMSEFLRGRLRRRWLKIHKSDWRS